MIQDGPLGEAPLSSLNDQTLSIWAKSKEYGPDPRQWLPLAFHLEDSRRVAAMLYDGWLCESQRDVIRSCILESQLEGFESDDIAFAVTTFIVGVHDIGKATPAFSCKVPNLDAQMAIYGLEHEDIPLASRRELPHGLAGELALQSWLISKEWSPRRVLSLGSLVGGHHGVPPSENELAAQRANPIRSLHMGSDQWMQNRNMLLDVMAIRSGFANIARIAENVKWTKQALVLIEGIVIAADWIASNEEYFPLFPESTPFEALRIELSDEALARRSHHAWELLDLPALWLPEDSGLDADSMLKTRFDLPSDARARPSQETALDAARAMDPHGLLIIEDSMGSGKTEAALMAAEILASRAGLGGVLFALPTQATTDAMMRRVVKWIDNLEANLGQAPQNLRLIHGRASLNQVSRDLVREGYNRLERHQRRPNQESSDDVTTPLHTSVGSSDQMRGYRTGQFPSVATDVNHDGAEHSRFSHPWTSSKKALLADVVTCTIDQLLLNALRSPHLALRHLGLSKKVVIIDEIHSYDAYMSVYLKTALTWLAAYGVPVIALSATLPSHVKNELHEAYSQGLKKPYTAITNGELGYPRQSYPVQGVLREVVSPPSTRPSFVSIKPLAQDSVVSKLWELLSGGGTALVVRSTVRSAQETFEELRGVFGNDVRLMHARFTSFDRLANDQWLLDNFGPPANNPQRPKRFIVVATQVVEQSLDIDFDVLITDLAPVDLILQRIGRLHRHAGRARPLALQEATCFVMGLPRESDTSPCIPHATAAVYKEYLPLRSAAVLRRLNREGRAVALPADVPALVEEVYAMDEPILKTWTEQELAAQADFFEGIARSKGNASTFLLGRPGRTSAGLIGWLDMNDSIQGDEGQAAVREGLDSIEVILVDEETVSGSRHWRTLQWIKPAGGEDLPMNAEPNRKQALGLALSMVRLPAWAGYEKNFNAVIDELDFHIEEWQRNPHLRGQLIMPLRQSMSELAGKILTYTRDTGLMEKTDE